jgi:hypothetical protein
MARRPPLTVKDKATAAGFFYLTEIGKNLLGLQKRGDEPDQFYLRRIARYQVGPGMDLVENIGRFTAPKETRHTDTVEEIQNEITQSLDTFVGSWISLGEQFLAAAEDADPERLTALAAQGAPPPINYRDPRTFATALHFVAAQGARPAFRALLKIGGCDFLARDKWGRLASEMAGVYGDDLAMERLLLKKEIRQARDQGIPLDRIYRRDRASGPAPTAGS